MIPRGTTSVVIPVNRSWAEFVAETRARIASGKPVLQEFAVPPRIAGKCYLYCEGAVRGYLVLGRVLALDNQRLGFMGLGGRVRRGWYAEVVGIEELEKPVACRPVLAMRRCGEIEDNSDAGRA